MAPVAQLDTEPKQLRDEDYPTGDGKPMAETPKHRNLMIYAIEALGHHYANDPMVYISGNDFVFYEQHNKRKHVSPDCYVAFGVGKQERDSYMLWKEGVAPQVVMEFTSRTTWDEDGIRKFALYERTLKVEEYFRYDPTGDYLYPRLQGFELQNGRYVPLPIIGGDRIYSRNLELYLVMQGEDFRFYNPRTDEYLKNDAERAAMYAQRVEMEAERAQRHAQRAEMEAERAEMEAERAEMQAERAEMQAQMRAEIEAENARLRAELDALKRQNANN